MKNRNVLMMVIVLLIVPQMLMARGAQDLNGQNNNPMMEKFEEITTELEAGNLGGDEAILQLNQFRESLKYENQEQFQLMESCLNAIDNGEMTKKEASEKVADMEQLREWEQIRDREQIQDATGDPEQIRTEEQTRMEGQSKGKTK